MDTPFCFRCALSPDDDCHRLVMVSRDDYVGQLMEDIDARRYPLIYGPRQIGKSTACLQLVDRVRRDRPEDWLAVYVNCGSLGGADTATAAQLLHDHVLEAALSRAEVLTAEAERVQETLRRMHRSDSLYQFQLFLDAMAKALSPVRRLILVVDEIETLPRETLYHVLSAFRTLQQKYAIGDTAFACCVVAACTHNVAALEIGPGSPYNIAWPRDLDEVPTKEWSRILDQLQSLPFDDGARKRLYDEVGGHPYLLQRVCDRAVTNAHEAGADHVTEAHVLDGVFWLFERGDRNLRLMTQSAQASPERQAACADVLKGEELALERLQPDINALAEVGLVAARRGRLAAFRNRLYERVMLNLFYRSLNGPRGRYLREHGTLLVGISEVQRAVLNEDLWKELLPGLHRAERRRRGDRAHLIEACARSLDKSANPTLRILDTGFVNASIRYILGPEFAGELDMADVLEALARLLVEKWEHMHGGDVT